MPAHPILALHDPPSLDLPVPQLGVCVKCQSTLDTSGPIAAPGVGTFVCSACRELLLLSSPRDPSDAREVRFDINLALVRLPSHDNPPSTRPIPDLDDSMLLGDVVNQRVSDHSRTSSDASSKPSTPLRKPALSCITTTSVSSVAPLSHSLVHHVTSTTASTVVIDSRRQNGKCMVPDPLIDITRLRIRTSSHYCLYPGATFVGTQKSGRSSYDVTVTVVDVDFASSFLCGYLRIRGLTDDWPELTTYFDAEIIGNRYGFLTQNWGASENDDMIHWSRFPAFKQIRPELREPMLTMTDRDRGAVFMRWKERFLVPDHRVQDISGASFAGEQVRAKMHDPGRNRFELQAFTMFASISILLPITRLFRRHLVRARMIQQVSTHYLHLLDELCGTQVVEGAAHLQFLRSASPSPP
ncbi:hypothetical protein AX15_006241 [Amanita polypyramis BW_CC]|nr:hypothetical protein AX15_006241 [Amanita polypyramis BW_CC]